MKVTDLKFKTLIKPEKPKGLALDSYVVIKTKPMMLVGGRSPASSRYNMPVKADNINWGAKGCGAVEAYAVVNKPNLKPLWGE